MTWYIISSPFFLMFLILSGSFIPCVAVGELEMGGSIEMRAEK